MNLILLIITITAVAIMLSESSITKQLSNMFYRFFPARPDDVRDFLSGLDNAPLSFEEINQFRNFLTSPSVPTEAPTNVE